MHYILTLYLAAMTPMGNVVPARTQPVFDTLNECMALGANYQGQAAEIKFTCELEKPGESNAAKTDKGH